MWYYKGDLRYGDDKDEGWKPYEDEENEKLERAYKNKKPIVKLNNKYKADLDKMFQYRIKDTTKQRKIKRVEVDSSDEDEPPKKKKKLSPPAIAGQEVWVVFDKKKNLVVGIHAEEETAELRAKKDTSFVIFSQIVAK